MIMGGKLKNFSIEYLFLRFHQLGKVRLDGKFLGRAE